MNNKLAVIATVLALAGCGERNDNNENAEIRDGSRGQDIPNPQDDQGLFIATLGDREYQAPVNCYFFEEGNLRMVSDKFGADDLNGDGLILTGFESLRGSFQLRINDNGKIYHAESISNFKSGDDKAEGSGKMRELEDLDKVYDVQFTISCS